MINKIVKKYSYHGLGFPIELHNVEMVKFENEYHPKIDVKAVADNAIHSLVLQKTRLTGNQIKFIRTYFAMSLREFAKVVNESHMAIKKWENFKAEPTNMDKNIEIMLRLYIYENIVMKIKSNNKNKIEFYHQFVTIREIFSSHLIKKTAKTPLLKHA